ncbi:hypothetical protein PMAYCL1PPCAC_04078, partial [Pristionchus mayeri]
DSLRDDPIYIGCFGIRGMNFDTALKVVYLKRRLDELIPSIPHHLRGDVDCALYFNTLIQVYILFQEGMEGDHSHIWLLNRATSFFRSSVKFCLDNVPNLRPTLQRIYANTPQFFDPNNQP